MPLLDGLDISDILLRVATRKVLVSLDSELVDRLDRAARERGVSRSAFLAELAARELGTRTPAEQKRIEQAHRDLLRLFRRNGTGGDVVEALREERTERLKRLSR